MGEGEIGKMGGNQDFLQVLRLLSTGWGAHPRSLTQSP